MTMQRTLGLAAVAAAIAVGVAPATARADYGDGGDEGDGHGLLSNLELSLGIGIIDRGTTGTGGSTLLGLEYDHAGGPYASFDARLFFDEDEEYFHHGFALRLLGTSGSALFGSAYGMRIAVLDAAYALRVSCPCMTSGDRRWFVTGMLGVTGAYTDAGTGSGDGDLTNERRAAATELDHVALGGVLAFDFAVHFAALVVGLGVDLRYLGAIDSPVARTFAASAGLRFGADLDL